MIGYVMPVIVYCANIAANQTLGPNNKLTIPLYVYANNSHKCAFTWLMAVYNKIFNRYY